jgi:hypothetical protein
MLWRACNLFAALVVCVCLFGRGAEWKVGFMGDGARAKTSWDVACMYDEARGTWLIRSERFHR